MLFRLLILVIQLKKGNYDKKVDKITEHDHSNKYITTQEFNRLIADYFAARLKQANVGSKNGSADCVKKTGFDEKLKYYKKLL